MIHFYALLLLNCIISIGIGGQNNIALKSMPHEMVILEPSNECRCMDSLVLVEFYEAMAGESWIDNWNLNQPLESWKGIALNNGDCVSSITLNSNNLVGIIPTTIGELKGLKNLSLGNNEISGPLPESLGDLNSLESLNLRNNQLTGILPIDLGKLTKLSTLNLSVNNLSGNIPTQIGNIRTLSGIFLNQNNFTGVIPIQLGNLSELVSLNFANNQLTGSIPTEIGLLSKLVGIGLNNNELTGELPATFGQLEKLVSLRLENNQLTGEIPASYGELTKIESIAFNDNNLSGCFPENLVNLCGLMEISVLFGTGYNFRNNPLLPWEGDFSQFCAGEDQMRANCNDGNPNTLEDGITQQCTCGELEPIMEPELVLLLDLKTKGTCPEENTGQLNLIIEPVNEEYLIDWSNPAGERMQWTSISNIQLEGLASGNHSLTITNIANPTLTSTQTFEINTLNCFDESQIMQLITPNGDGLNERFIFDDLENNPSLYNRNELLIFNRWGDVVFKAQPYKNDWSGHNNTGQTLPEGTYYYVFKLDLNEGQVIKGDITIIR